MLSKIFRIFKKKIDGKTAEEWFNEGVVLYNQGKYERAIECFDKSLTIKDDPEVRRIKRETEIKSKKKRAKRAIEDTKKIISQMKPEYNVKEAEGILSQAEEAFRKGDYSKAEELALKAEETAINAIDYFTLFVEI